MNTNDQRIADILKAIAQYTQKDFSGTIPVSGDADGIQAIAIALNKMAGELQAFIEDQKVTAEKLKRSNELFTNLFENNPACLAISRLSDATIMDVNRSFIESFGFSSKQEVIGKTAAELKIVDGSQRDRTVALLREKKKLTDVEGQMRNRNGELKWVSISMLPVQLDDLPCLMAVMLDITDRKKTEDQLKALNKELEAFSYSVSHDLRAPLRAVNGYAQVLNEDYGDKLDEEGKRFLEAIRYNSVKMGTLIDELLAFSRLGRKEVNKKEIDMNELTETVLHTIGKSVNYEAKIKTGKLHKVQGEYGLLHQVMFHLISNAIKYSSKRKEPVIEISSHDTDKEIIFSIKDNGAGFDMKYADKLFGVFQRLHSEEEFDGTGVGLAIVQRIIAKHGGKVWAEGKLNEGATFYFSLTKQERYEQ
jgi:PAS domain S-box-containing protein